MRASLLVRGGGLADRTVALPDGAITLLGRGAANTVVLDHAEAAAVHCLLAPAREAGRFVLVDAWSRGGTEVNGRSAAKCTVGVGDVVGIGPFELEVRAATGAGADAAGAGRGGVGEAAFELEPRRGEMGSLELRPGSATVVGRHELADVRVSDPFVSEFHLLVAVDGDRTPLLVDLRSSNGTRLDGRPVHAARLLPGHAVSIGQSAFTVRRAGGRPAPQGVGGGDAAAQPAGGTTEVLTLEAPGAPASYQAFHGLDDLPFRLTADPDYFFHSQRHGEALEVLRRWMRQGLPVGLLTGPPGCGKSLVVACLARELAYRRPRAVVVRPGLEDWALDDLILATVARAKALHGDLPADGATPLELWHATLAELRRRNVLVALLVDDAETAGRGFVDGLGSLLDTAPARVATRILLAGGEGLERVAAGHSVSGWLGAQCRLAPLPRHEVAGYIAHRLVGASGRRELVFTRRAIELIAAHSRGIPRLINVVADAALFGACRASRHQVDQALVAQAIRDALGTSPPARA